MYPVISLGPLDIRIYSLMKVAAVLVLVIGIRHRLHRLKRPFPKYNIVEAVLFLIPGAIGGAWLAHNLPKWVMSAAPPFPTLSWLEGRHWMGLMGGGALLGYIYCRLYSLPVGTAFDIYAPLLPLMQATIRLGCLSAGCCYGRETTAWPAMVLPDIHGVWASRYPTRIVSLIVHLFMAIFLLSFERYNVKRMNRPEGWPFDGFLFLLYVELYCVQRFYFEFWRADMPPLVGPFTWTHPYCLIGIGLATWLMVRGLRARRALADTDSS